MAQVVDFFTTLPHIYVGACLSLWAVWLFWDRSHKGWREYLLMFVLLVLMLFVGYFIIRWFGW